MSKPLLTDEILAQAKKRQSRQAFGYYQVTDEELAQTPIDAFQEEYQGYEEGQTVRIPVQASIVKSRRIETMKKAAFGAKVNKLLFWVVVLVILFLLAVLYL